MKKLFVTVALLLIACIGCASDTGRTYSLAIIDTPFKLPKDYYPYIERSSDAIGSVSDITIKDNTFLFNGNLCSYEIKSLEEFRIDRVLADAIDDAGGKQKFLTFVKSKLKSDMANWKQQYFLKASNKDSENGGCKLLQNGFIYQSENELIVWDTQFFYRFVRSKDFKFGQ